MTQLQLGDQAPNFTAQTSDNKPFHLHDHLKDDNRFHLLVFFRGEWCPVCNEQLQDLQENLHVFKELNTHVMAISTDQPENLQKLKENHHISFPVLHDEKEEALKAFGVYTHEDTLYEDHGHHGEPGVFLIDPEKRILHISVQTGPFGRPSAEDLRKTIKYIQKTL
ncbi:peroxiredoxin family protein [Fictibacillus macauensis]|nr:redoxin domain-containing protein [Fictibacillus macauensis]